MILMGYIKEVLKNQLLIGLPFGLVGCVFPYRLTCSTVEKAETSNSLFSLQEDEEGLASLSEIDLHNLYTVNTRVIVVVLELKSVMPISPLHSR